MKHVRLAVILLAAGGLAAADGPPSTLRGVLLEQLQTTHNKKDWFVPVMTALEGLTAGQASWKDPSGGHSAGQLANHLLFWNSQTLAKLKGEKPAAFSGNNDETFNRFDAKLWRQTVTHLDQVLGDIEKLVQAADDQQLAKWASTIAHIGTHNAYHTGQIISVRKLQGSWDPAKGVK
ncbi:MAG: DinB family protein [Bryobacterales bacterium]|nr:DinB family protein [Bryobacterales bacterium]